MSCCWWGGHGSYFRQGKSNQHELEPLQNSDHGGNARDQSRADLARRQRLWRRLRGRERDWSTGRRCRVLRRNRCTHTQNPADLRLRDHAAQDLIEKARAGPGTSGALTHSRVRDTFHVVGTVPPSMMYSVPVIEPARGETRKATSSATSFGRAGRPIGMPPSESIKPLRAVS